MRAAAAVPAGIVAGRGSFIALYRNGWRFPQNDAQALLPDEMGRD